MTSNNSSQSIGLKKYADQFDTIYNGTISRLIKFSGVLELSVFPVDWIRPNEIANSRIIQWYFFSPLNIIYFFDLFYPIYTSFIRSVIPPCTQKYSRFTKHMIGNVSNTDKIN